ncbi:uncharacterized protein LOC131025423 [Salvia miltiorrhiza]|uniref:uncharacterized protein LOC131025423 n=1 Tax=Salvia miltiorrhiza TaxID=226208 RepID=UPI0025ACC4BB|nr:uncharacterized protein LOC131025423 [Salvia miltiorrhiza]
MACRSVSWPPLPTLSEKRSNFAPRSLPHKKLSNQDPNCGRKLTSNHKSKSHHFVMNCLNNGKSDFPQQDQPQDALLKAISEVSRREGRVGQATIVVFGGSVSGDSTSGWLALDRKLNSYPRKRGFTAIGTGGDDFVQAMVYAVESVVQRPIPQGQVRQKISSRGKYVSVKIGPVQVASSEQVQAVYYAMRRDDRMKYFL